MDNVDNRTRSAEQSYYENEGLWGQDFEQDPDERERFAAARALIPTDVRSLVDVGCGNGAFLNGLTRQFDRACGVDRSESALKFVRTEKRIASADNLPFADGEFDLAASMEVIEHLPQACYAAALAELVRVARRWIMVSVPYQEDRRLGLVRCPKCLCEFNRSYHLRSFDSAAMKSLFGSIDPGIQLTDLKTLGQSSQYIGLRTAKRLAEPYRALDLPVGAVCPQCGHFRPAATGASGSGSRGRTGLLGRAKAFWPQRAKPRWYLGLYLKP